MKPLWQSAWIIGGSTGLGAEAAKQLAAMGVKTYVSARSQETLEGLCKNHQNLISLPLDITDAEACIKAVSNVMEQTNGLPDLIILNAAVYKPMSAKDFDVQAIANMINVNYLGIANMFEVLLPHRLATNPVTIATVTSPSGWRGLPGGVGYGPTKAALINLVEGLKPELDKTSFDLRLINPGFIKTRLTDKNEFDMPQLMEPDYAARKMLKGLTSNRFDIAFPNPFIFFFRVLKVLPDWLYFKITRKMVN